MNQYTLSIRPFGAHAILIEWPQSVDEAILDDILTFTAHMKLNHLDSQKWEIVPSYNSVTLVLREKPIDFKEIKEKIEDWYAEDFETKSRQRFLWASSRML